MLNAIDVRGHCMSEFVSAKICLHFTRLQTSTPLVLQFIRLPIPSLDTGPLDIKIALPDDRWLHRKASLTLEWPCGSRGHARALNRIQARCYLDPEVQVLGNLT